MYDIELMKELAGLQVQFADDVVKLADKYGVDRDDLVKLGVSALVVMSEVGTLAEYKKGGVEND